MPLASNPKNEFISEVRTGFQVRLPKIGVHKYFANNDGGRDAALIAALAFRDAILASTRYPSGGNYRAHSRMRGRSSDPEHLGGLLLMVHRRNGDAGIHAYFKASYMDEQGRYRNKSFAVRKYGYVRAYQLALEVRSQYVDTVAAALARMPRPTPRQYALLSGLAPDIPNPRSAKGS